MLDGRTWALTTFGQHGAWIRSTVLEKVLEEHASAANAQNASGHQSTTIYGQFYIGIAERFQAFGRELSNVAEIRPGGAPYKVPVIGGVVLFPWRYSGKPEDRIESTAFETSEARVAVIHLGPQPVQGTLDFGLPDPGLMDHELALVAEIARNPAAVSATSLVLVAIRSSVDALHAVEWGDVKPTADGHLTWGDFHEDLLNASDLRPAPPTDPDYTFTSGPIPPKFPEPPESAVDTQRGA